MKSSPLHVVGKSCLMLLGLTLGQGPCCGQVPLHAPGSLTCNPRPATRPKTCNPTRDRVHFGKDHPKGLLQRHPKACCLFYACQVLGQHKARHLSSNKHALCNVLFCLPYKSSPRDPFDYPTPLTARPSFSVFLSTFRARHGQPRWSKPATPELLS